MDIGSGKFLWRNRTRTRMQSAALTTGGGLVVAGDWDRNLYIHAAATGKILFQTPLSSAVQGYPMTHAVNGRQYIAVPVGAGSALFTMPKQIFPERNLPPPGNALFVFALPEGRGPVAASPSVSTHQSRPELERSSVGGEIPRRSGPGGQQ